MASKCALEFRDVSFSYVAESPVIKDVSFTCPGGQTLALVGATGWEWLCSARRCASIVLCLKMIKLILLCLLELGSV